MTDVVVTKNFGEVNDFVYSLKIYFVWQLLWLSLNVIKVARELLWKCCCCFKCSSLQPLKVAQNNIKHFPKLNPTCSIFLNFVKSFFLQNLIIEKVTLPLLNHRPFKLKLLLQVLSVCNTLPWCHHDYSNNW